MISKFTKNIYSFSLAKAQYLSQKSGDVFTWNQGAPTKLNISQKVKRVVLGQRHNALISQSGTLYTYGGNKYGQLGHGNTNQYKEPTPVQYFVKKGIKVKQAACGQFHTAVLTEQGHVYTFGNGGRRKNPISNFFNRKSSPLGHGNQQNIYVPAKIKSLNDIDIITSGNAFNFTQNKDGKILYWGCGQFGVSGDGRTKNCSVPQQIQQFEYYNNQQKIFSKKIKSCDNYSICLMNNGLLYGWGSNRAGQIGVTTQIGIEVHQSIHYPHQVIRQGFDGIKVSNFDSSQFMLIFQLQNGQFKWCGKHYAYKPQDVNIQQPQNIKLFAAGHKGYVLLSKDNKIYNFGDFINLKGGQTDIKTSISSIQTDKVFSGQVLAIGGQYQQKFAIIA